MKTEIELGIHENVSSSEYHQWEGVSNSDLKIFGSLSPAHYIANKKEPKEETDSMKRGTILHLAILEPDKFGDGTSHYVRVPSIDFRTKEGKAWRDSHQDKPILTTEEAGNIENAAFAVFNNATAKSLLTGRGRNEVSVLAQHPETGLKLRMRADRLTEDASGRPWIVDIKSCQDVRKFAWTARDFLYDFQNAFYVDTLGHAGVPDAIFRFIAVEIEPTYGIHGVQVITLEDEVVNTAREIYEGWLIRFAECQRAGEWPGYAPESSPLNFKRFVQ